MTGSLYIKNNTWYAILNLPEVDGKYRQKWVACKLKAFDDHGKIVNSRKARELLIQQIIKFEKIEENNQ